MTDEAPKVTGRRVAAKAKKVSGKVNAARIAQTGLTSRIQGHVAARGRRTQGKRDSR